MDSSMFLLHSPQAHSFHDTLKPQRKTAQIALSLHAVVCLISCHMLQFWIRDAAKMGQLRLAPLILALIVASSSEEAFISVN